MHFATRGCTWTFIACWKLLKCSPLTVQLNRLKANAYLQKQVEIEDAMNRKVDDPKVSCNRFVVRVVAPANDKGYRVMITEMEI